MPIKGYPMPKTWEQAQIDERRRIAGIEYSNEQIKKQISNGSIAIDPPLQLPNNGTITHYKFKIHGNNSLDQKHTLSFYYEDRRMYQLDFIVYSSDTDPFTYFIDAARYPSSTNTIVKVISFIATNKNLLLNQFFQARINYAHEDIDRINSEKERLNDLIEQRKEFIEILSKYVG